MVRHSRVTAGSLVVSGQLGATTVSVDVTGILAGTVAGGASVSGFLSPGNTVGVLKLGSLTLGGTAAFDLGTGGVRGTDYDGITVTTPDSLVYGGVLSLSFAGPVADNTTFDLFSFSGTSAGLFSTVTSTGAYAGTWSTTGNGTWQLTSGTQIAVFNQATGDLAIIPEPTTLTAGLATVGITLVMLRRRHRG